jgi:chromate transporter
MTDWSLLWQIAADYLGISLLAVGAGVTTLPEMHRNAVERHAWMSDAQFAELFALSQAAPGPTTTMFSAIIGWHVAGPAGALVAVLGFLGPSCILAYISNHLWTRFRDSPWRERIQAGLVPVTVGLMFAAAWLVGRGAAHTHGAYVATALACILMLTTKINPLWLVAAGALAGLMGLL